LIWYQYYLPFLKLFARLVLFLLNHIGNKRFTKTVQSVMNPLIPGSIKNQHLPVKCFASMWNTTSMLLPTLCISCIRLQYYGLVLTMVSEELIWHSVWSVCEQSTSHRNSLCFQNVIQLVVQCQNLLTHWPWICSPVDLDIGHPLTLSVNLMTFNLLIQWPWTCSPVGLLLYHRGL